MEAHGTVEFLRVDQAKCVGLTDFVVHHEGEFSSLFQILNQPAVECSRIGNLGVGEPKNNASKALHLFHAGERVLVQVHIHHHKTQMFQDKLGGQSCGIGRPVLIMRGLIEAQNLARFRSDVGRVNPVASDLRLGQGRESRFGLQFRNVGGQADFAGGLQSERGGKKLF